MELLTGCNFSGKSRELIGRADALGGVYVGSDIYTYLSGFCVTFLEEILLTSRDGAGNLSLNFLEENFITELADRDLHTLSGGELALAVILSAVESGAKHLSFDNCFEQIEVSFRKVLIEYVRKRTRENGVTVSIGNPIEFIDEVLLFDNVTRMNNRTPFHGEGILKKIDVKKLSLVSQKKLDIHLEGVSFSYKGGGAVLTDAGLHLAGGETYILEGKNGAGKSTLSKILSGIIFPLKGDIYVGGKIYYPHKKPGETFSYHFQNPDFQLFASSVKEEFNSTPINSHGKGEAFDDSFRQALIDAFGFGDCLSLHPLDLPFIARKRLAIAVAVLRQTPWVILDEPTLGQDEESCMQIANLTRLLNKAGIGVVVVSHSCGFKKHVGGKTLVILDGKICERSNG